MGQLTVTLFIGSRGRNYGGSFSKMTSCELDSGTEFVSFVTTFTLAQM